MTDAFHDLDALIRTGDQFATILADPPWQFTNKTEVQSAPLPAVNIGDLDEGGARMICTLYHEQRPELFVEVGGVRIAKRENGKWTPLVAGWREKAVSGGIAIEHDMAN